MLYPNILFPCYENKKNLPNLTHFSGLFRFSGLHFFSIAPNPPILLPHPKKNGSLYSPHSCKLILLLLPISLFSDYRSFRTLSDKNGLQIRISQVKILYIEYKEKKFDCNYIDDNNTTFSNIKQHEVAGSNGFTRVPVLQNSAYIYICYNFLCTVYIYCIYILILYTYSFLFHHFYRFQKH